MKHPDKRRIVHHRGRATKDRCLRIFRRLSEYLDGELSPRLSKKIDRHMKGCANCCAFFNTFKKTVALCKTAPARPVPENVRARLLRLIRLEAGIV
jgi:anti-sigma factor (TIGR02949 family)